MAQEKQQNTFFSSSLQQQDSTIADLIQKELLRQQEQIELIASENIVSRAVLEAQGSVLTNKYAEGYPGKRYYNGCEVVDDVEDVARDRAKKLFNCAYANVQPHSGSQANQGAFMALLQPGDTILGMGMNAGGHLTHGAAPNQSGKWFNAVSYDVCPDTHLIDYDQVEAVAKEHKPKLIIAGATAYARQIDFAKFRQIADSVDAYLMADIAHYSGLVAAGEYPSPIPHAHVVTTTTHKTLRGPRGGMILCNDAEFGKKFNRSIFPGMQGGPLMHVIAAKAVAFAEALQPEYKEYIRAVIENARALSEALKAEGFDIVSGGTDSHKVLVDLRPKGLKGNAAADSLDRAGLASNKNGVPGDPESPVVTSGIRVGTPSGTTRGFGVAEFQQIARWIGEVLDGLQANPDNNQQAEQKVREEVKALCQRFPIY